MKNQFINKCSGITPDGVYGVVAVGIPRHFYLNTKNIDIREGQGAANVG